MQLVNLVSPPAVQEEILEQIRAIMQSGRFVMGSQVDELEQSLADFVFTNMQKMRVLLFLLRICIVYSSTMIWHTLQYSRLALPVCTTLLYNTQYPNMQAAREACDAYCTE